MCRYIAHRVPFRGVRRWKWPCGRLPDHLKRVIVPGMVTLQGLSALVRLTLRLTVRLSDTSHETPVQVVFDDPFKLLLAGDPTKTAALLEQMDSRAARITYRHAPRLVALTINPSYPAFDGTVYHPALLDPPTVLQRFRGTLTTPVADVFAPGGESLFCRLFLIPPRRTSPFSLSSLLWGLVPLNRSIVLRFIPALPGRGAILIT